MLRIRALVDQEHLDLRKRRDDEENYPKCSAKRTKSAHLVWCDSGRVPRRRSVYGGAERCACFESPQNAALDPGENGLYDNCDPSNSTCALLLSSPKKGAGTLT